MLNRFTLQILLLAFLLALTACDHGLAPPEEQLPGAIRGIITYTGHPDSWPPPEEVNDLRFVAMRFVPQDTADFLQLNRMAISGSLRYGVPSDTFSIDQVEPGTFLYSGVAQQFSTDLLSWRPVGLYEDEDGIFEVRSQDTTHLTITVDFNNPPVFPPSPVNP